MLSDPAPKKYQALSVLWCVVIRTELRRCFKNMDPRVSKMNQRSLWCLNLSGRATASNRMQSLLIFDFFIGYLRYYYDLIGSYTSLLTKFTIWAVRTAPLESGVCIRIVPLSPKTPQIHFFFLFTLSTNIHFISKK